LALILAYTLPSTFNHARCEDDVGAGIERSTDAVKGGFRSFGR
jgi:hypothetical protein